MTAKLEQLDGLKRQLEITIQADEINKRYTKKTDELARKANIKGFRPGKVPTALIEKRFGRGLLHEAAAESVESSLQSELQAQNIKLAGMPKIDLNLEQYKAGEPIVYKATFEIYPEIQLQELSDVEIESLSGEVTDEDVSAMLIRMRTQHAQWLLVDREAKLGDRVKIDFDGEMDGKPLEKGSAKGNWLELGSRSMISGFEEGLIGAKKGETKTLNLTFPADYYVEDLRSKPVVFTVTVHEVQEPKLPALDDDFAKTMKTDSLDALKKQVKEKMQADLNEQVRFLIKQNVLDKLILLHPIIVPDALVEAEISHLQEMTRQQMHQFSGGKMSASDINKFPLARDHYVEDAKKRVILGLLLAEVIKKHDIKVNQNKVNSRLKTLAAQYGNVDEILPVISQNKQMVANIEAFVLEEQAVDVLLSKARVLEVKKSYDVIMNMK